MAHTFYFGNVKKRINSTLQGGTNAAYDVLFKSPTSLDTPTITLHESGDFDYNYARYKDNYYFVTDKKALNNDIWEVSMQLDALATAKPDILATNAYVLYDSVPNTEIPDNRLPIKTSATVVARTAACPFTPDSGCYILSLTGANNSTGVYKVSESELSNLIDDVSYIMDDIWDVYNNPPAPIPYGNDVAENIKIMGQNFIADLQWRLDCIRKPIAQIFGSGDIPQNIRECKYIPFNVGTTGSPQQIYLGTFETGQSLAKITTETVHRTTSVSIPWQSLDFRRRSPYTEIYLYLPYIGMVKLSSENLIGQNTLSVAYTLALRDGTLICTVSAGIEIIGQYSGNVGISVPVGISNLNMGKVAQTVLTGIGALATKNIGMIGMSALNFADSVTPNFTCLGGLDGLAGVGTNQNITCYSVFHDTIAPPNEGLNDIGAPSMCFKNLGSLHGFCQCSDAHVSTDLDAPWIERIDNYLNSGFYIE